MSTRYDPYSYRNWAAFDTQPNGKSKIVKQPLRVPDLRWASQYDPNDWTDYQITAAFVRANPRYGLIFNLTGTPFFAVDLDTYKTQDPAIIEMHRQIYEWMDSYAELSLRGGVHILGHSGNGPVLGGKKHEAAFVEMICASGSCITRNPSQWLNRKPIEERWEKYRELLNWIIAEQNQGKRDDNAWPPPVSSLPVSTKEGREEDDHPGLYELSREELTDDDIAICTSAAKADNGPKFKAHYLGQWKDGNKSQSQLDQSLLNYLCFHQWVRQGTRDDLQVARLFMRSAYGARLLTTNDKSRNYLWTSIGTGWDFKRPSIELKSKGGA